MHHTSDYKAAYLLCALLIPFCVAPDGRETRIDSSLLKVQFSMHLLISIFSFSEQIAWGSCSTPMLCPCCGFDSSKMPNRFEQTSKDICSGNSSWISCTNLQYSRHGICSGFQLYWFRKVASAHECGWRQTLIRFLSFFSLSTTAFQTHTICSCYWINSVFHGCCFNWKPHGRISYEVIKMLVSNQD